MAGGAAAAAAARERSAAQAEALREAQAENSFLRQELAELQTALQRSERAVNLMFVKNIIVRFMKEGDLENSLPAIAQALDFSAAEVAEIRQSRGPGGIIGRDRPRLQAVVICATAREPGNVV